MLERIFKAPNGDTFLSDASDDWTTGGGDFGATVDAANIGRGVEKYCRVVGVSVVVVVVIIIGRLGRTGNRKKINFLAIFVNGNFVIVLCFEDYTENAS